MADQGDQKKGNGAATVVGAGTVEGMMAFLDYLVSKGYAPEATVHPLKVASRIIFSRMEGEEKYGSFDVRSFDPDEYMDRFQNRVVGEYKQESLTTYRQRMKRAVSAYREYLSNGNVSAIRSAGTRAPRRKKVDPVPEPQTVAQTNGNGHDGPDVSGSLIDYPFPLRSGTVAHLRLPMKLDKTDADRLGVFLRALVYEPQLELPAPEAEAA